MAPLRILIVGCGIAGSTLASFLLLSDLPPHLKPHITILERASGLRHQGQNIDIRGSGLTIIRKLGLETLVRASTTGEEGVQLVDKNNQIWAAFGADKSGKTSTPTADIEILRGRLAEICWLRSKQLSDEVQKAGGPGIEYLSGDYLAELSQDGSEVNVRYTKSGKTQTFDLVVGADGLQSQVRNLAWGPEEEDNRLKRLGMYGGFFSMPRGPTDSLWRRWFHAPGRRGIMVRPDGTGERTTVFMHVINDADDRLPKAAKAGRDGIDSQKRLLQEYFNDAGWESRRVIEEMMEAKDFYYDMVAQVHMDRWSKGRVVLLGDAGYCASPISGMGTTLALNGAYNLAGALFAHPEDHTAAFAQYEESMRPVVVRAQKLAPGVPYLINPETAWGIWTLNSIMYVIWVSGVIQLLSRFVGPPANIVPVEDYGFRELSDWIDAPSLA